ncbi:MAG: 4-hydroxythreonine-4-phosphate dehydrogenase PdxA [Balneolaceae bacterium]|nr:4-hydroxythreonine-4-phosphate dehydrogenase PdxA [Balneolaceae bacterium]
MSMRLAISLGDYNGIGPEVVLKALSERSAGGPTPVLLGSEAVLRFYASRMQRPPSWRMASGPGDLAEGELNLLPAYGTEDEPNPGVLSEAAGLAAMKAVETGVDLCLQGHVHGLVTAPISKEAVNRAGYRIPGHTEFLAERTGASSVLMVMVRDNLRVALLTGHLPLAEVAGQLDGEALDRSLKMLNRSLQDDFGVEEPRIAVLGLNPHAGDGGVIGEEELRIIGPRLDRARQTGLRVSGPHPADAFFGNRSYESHDAVLAMYHDQGLIPFKTLSFGRGVNVTAGLPIVRTSPDHGTAFDIAGTNSARPTSFAAAWELAGRLARNRSDGEKMQET